MEPPVPETVAVIVKGPPPPPGPPVGTKFAVYVASDCPTTSVLVGEVFPSLHDEKRYPEFGVAVTATPDVPVVKPLCAALGLTDPLPFEL